MQIKFWQHTLKLTHRWTIARALGPAGSGPKEQSAVVFVELRDSDGVIGLGESAPSRRYHEDEQTTLEFLQKVDPSQLKFADVPASMEYLNRVAPENFAPKAALNIALLDGAARLADQPIYDFIGLGFTENKHVTSFTIGIDKPEQIRKKVAEAAAYPVLKLKLGSPNDKEILDALREVAPKTTVRVDGNEGWKTKEEALDRCEWLAADGHIQFVEQPMPAQATPKDLSWLKERTPLPLMADESYLSATDLTVCAECFHAVNVKLVKTGGISGAYEALQAARNAGLKTMLGCMIESSILISAAAHLAELTDYLDLDGNLLITNDPYQGVSSRHGVLSFSDAPQKLGLRVKERKR